MRSKRATEGLEHSMSRVVGSLRPVLSRWQFRLPAAGLSACLFAVACVAWLTAAPRPAAAADPAVKFMAQVGRELVAAARTQLSVADRVTYYGGMVRFISRYAATEAPKYPVARVEWADQSIRGANGTMVDSKVVLEDGSEYEVRWLLTKIGDSYKVRDAMVVGFWMTPFLKKLFEDYIAQNGGNPSALVAALNR
jgi:phospholipid transport system substrate-binding protein